MRRAQHYTAGEIVDMKRPMGVFCMLMGMFAGAAWGASVPGSLSSDYLGTPDWLRRTTIGVDVEQVGRTVSPDGGQDVSLDLLAYSLFVGIDLGPAMTVFGTLGGTDDNTLDGEDSGSGLKVSGGLNLNLARYDLRQPPVLDNDRVTVRAVAELAYYDGDTTEWWQGTLALPLAYEIVENNRVATVPNDERMVLAVSVGPQLSVQRGQFNTDRRDVDFDEAQSLGLIAGIDLYLAPVVSFGVRVEFFDADDDEITGGASMRYHF